MKMEIPNKCWLFRESEDLDSWIAIKSTSDDNVGILHEDYQMLCAGKLIRPILHAHPVAGKDPVEKLLKIPVDGSVTAVGDWRDFKALMGSQTFQTEAYKQESGVVLLRGLDERVLSDPLTQEQQQELGAVETLTCLPYDMKRPHVRRQTFVIRQVSVNEKHSILVRVAMPVFDKNLEPIAVWPNKRTHFSRWLDLYLEMWASGAQSCIIAYHRKGAFVRFETFDVDVVKAMLDESEIEEAMETLGRALDAFH